MPNDSPGRVAFGQIEDCYYLTYTKNFTVKNLFPKKHLSSITTYGYVWE